MSEEAAGGTPDLTTDEMAEVARFGIHDDDDESDVMPRRARIFQLDNGLSDADLRDALQKYRAECDDTPWEPCMVGVLDCDFVNWFRFEAVR